MVVVVLPEVIEFSCQVERTPERGVIKELTPDGADDPLDERVGRWGVGNRLDFSHIQYSQVGLPTVTCEQRIIVSAQTLWWGTTRDRLVEHSAYGDAVYITCVYTEPDDMAAPLIHDHEYPVRLEREGLTAE